ncbi:MAG: tRNA pseudouridine(38-40) synthase TruA [Candidatus Eremiobacteraeota bacterium]|nr:tRNA pseudouridine(38-40) synthase TruA [Candidatus Eremiobacteraeota bacterium]
MERRDAGGVRHDARSHVPARFRGREDGAATGESLTTLRLTVEYDGTEFSGFQWQPEERTVAGVLEAALSQLFSESVKVTGAGRTDSGVHATGQVISCATNAVFPFDRLLVALRGLLPPDCCAREASAVESGFSARFAARERTYVYAILNRSERSALLARYAHHVATALDVRAMKTGAACLVGEQDFRSFAAAAPDERTTRSIRSLEVRESGELVRIEITADGFLHHMVRTIVGTLIECGTGRRSPGEIERILEARDRTAAGPTAPPQGLYLAGVRYADGYDSFAEPPILRG